MAEKGLGKGLGLGALFGDKDDEWPEDIVSLPLIKVEPKADQPRNNFDDDSLNELAGSIERYGVIQPITVRKLDTGYYQIIAGERRWRAARIAGLDKIPVRVVKADDMRVTELALVENLQREDLNPIEEANGFKRLIEEYGMTQEQAAQSVGRSRPAVANSLRLLSLCSEICEMVEDGKLSAGHARALLQIKEPAKQISAAKKVVEQGLSVRQAETLASKLTDESAAEKEKSPLFEVMEVNYIGEVEKKLTSSLGRKVKINEKRRKKGCIELEFYDREDFELLIKALSSINENKI